MNHHTQTTHRDAATTSIWQTEAETQYNLATFKPDIIYDVVIIGGGITGLTTALLLQEAGKNCIIAEAYTPGFGTTGGTTAHINTFLDNSYNYIEKDFGQEGSRLVADATKEAIQLVDELVKRLNIDCDFSYKKGYLYADDDKEADELKDILNASQRAGISVHVTDTIPVPVSFKKAIVFDQQAQIHPLKYLQGLAKAFTQKGGVILEDTLIKDIAKAENYHLAKAENTTIKAKKIVYATHIPPGINLLHFRCAPYRSYVLAVRLLDSNYPADLAYDLKDPYHYVRTQQLNGESYLIVGGDDHKTGHGNPEESFASLENYVRQHYSVSSIDYKWSAQYYIPADGLPYIGKLPGFDQDVYTATGFSGNGITLGSISAKILSDLILEKENRYANLFSPSRIKPVAGFTEFVKENADVAYHFVADRLSIIDIDSIANILPDSGAVIEYNDKKLAVYKSNSGEIHALSPVCTHAKCIVNWNNVEKSWDCPCHGARFDINGDVLNGPASVGLQKIELQN